MIHFIKPYGFISKSLIVRVFKNKFGCFLLDKSGNRLVIEEKTFNQLKKEGYMCEKN